MVAFLFRYYYALNFDTVWCNHFKVTYNGIHFSASRTHQLPGMASTLRMRTTIRQETLVHNYASVNSSCAHASWPNLRALAFNVLALNDKFPGSETHKLPNDPRWEQRRGQIPLPKSSLQQFSLTAQSRNATLSNLRSMFHFSETSAFVIVLL